MLRILRGKSSPALALRKPKEPPLSSSNSTSKSKSQTLIICSGRLPDVAAAAAKSSPPNAQTFQSTQQAPDGYHHHLQAELLPPETVISILHGFAKVLLRDRERFELLKLKCLEGAKLGPNDDLSASTTGSILKSSHTVLTYLCWGIRHIEKASASLHEAEKESKEDHLMKAEQMLRSLTDSMQLELDDHPTAVFASERVPNAGFILGLAHVFLALVWMMRKNTSKLVASHLLEAFVVSPKDARQSFIPELWSQLFRPHLSAVDAWYKKEHINILSSCPRSSSILTKSKPCSPSLVDNTLSPIPANAAVCRANSLMDLVAGMKLSNRGKSSTCNESNIVQNEHDQSKLLERMNMQVNLLSNLYEQSLDEGTVQYARHYQDLVVRYYGRFSFDQTSKTQMALPHSSITRSHINQEEVTSDVKGAAVPDACTQVGYDPVESKVMSGGGWIGANALQLRRSLYDAIFGIDSMEKTSKRGSSSHPSPSSQVSSLLPLRLCNKELPQVLDPLRPKVEMDLCAYVSSDEPTAERPQTAGKPATMRDVVNTALSPAAQEVNILASCTTVLTRSHVAEIIVNNDLSIHNQESSTSINGAELTELSPLSHVNHHPQITSKRATVVKSVGHPKRLIDFIQDRNHHSGSLHSSTPNHENNEVGDQLSQQKSSSTAMNFEGTKVKQQRLWTFGVDGKYTIMKRSNSESSAPAKSHDHQGLAAAKGRKRMMNLKIGSGRSEAALVRRNAGKLNAVNRKKVEEDKDVQVKLCTSVQVQQTRASRTNNTKDQFKKSSNIDTASQAISSRAGASAGHVMCNQLGKLANELRAVVRATRLSGTVAEDVGRCEEVLLKLSQAWLECKSATLLQQKEGADMKDDKLEGCICDGIAALDGLTEALLFILATSELQEAQRLALCLLSATTSSNVDESTSLRRHDHIAEKRGEYYKSAGGQLPSDPNVLQALSHLLQQRDRLPEAALLLHLLHPTQYSASCHHFLPHLLPLLLDLAQHNGLPMAHNVLDHCASSYNSPFHGRLHLFGDSLRPRALALMMMSRLLAVVDKVTRLQACKHVLFPNMNALPCLLHSLDCALSLDERAATAFILTTCMQADDKCRQHIVKHVKLTSVVALLQHSSSNTSAFQTAVNFVTELLHTRKVNITEMLGCIRQDGLLNCMHALMAYLQTASLENQPPAAGLLLQLDLLLGDEQRYSVFREEALEALLAPLLLENNKEASFNAARVLSTIGRSHSEQELEAWLLKKAGLGVTTPESFNTSSHCYITSSANPLAPASKDQEEEESAVVTEWDERVARALIGQGGGGLVSRALAKGLRSSMAEVRKACLLVVAWLTSHLRHQVDQNHGNLMSVEAKATANERMREALQAQLQEIAAVGSGCAIVERIFAALALQNLAQ